MFSQLMEMFSVQFSKIYVQCTVMYKTANFSYWEHLSCFVIGLNLSAYKI